MGKEEILEILENIQKQFEVKILYAVEAGSRSWGTASSTSDFDVRFIYKHPTDWYLSVDFESQPQVIEINEGGFDVVGWELRKTLKLFQKSNPSLMEWLVSTQVYFGEEKFVEGLKSLISDYYEPSACLHHYRQMAEGNFRSYLKGEEVRLKKYFYVIRPLLAIWWIEKNPDELVPLNFEELIHQTLKEGEFKNILGDLLQRKREGQLTQSGSPIPELVDFIESEFRRLKKQQWKVSKNRDFEKLDQFFRETLK